MRAIGLVLAGLVVACESAPTAAAPDVVGATDAGPPRDEPPPPPPPPPADGGVSDRPDVPPPADAPPARLGEGFTDLSGAYVGRPGYSVLRDMTFGEPEPSYGLMADLDGDGSTEVLLSTDYMDRMRKGRRSLVMRYDTTGRALVPVAAEGPDWSVRAALDLDGDGRVDLVGFDNRPVVAWGRADRTFDAPVALDASQEGQFINYLAGVHFDDLDGDGWLDVIVGYGECCPGCRAAQPYLRTGARTFRLARAITPQAAQTRPYVVGTLRVEGATHVLFALGGGCEIDTPTPVLYRPTGAPDGSLAYEVFDPFPPQPAFHMGTGTPFISRYIPMGATGGDLDGDGLFDVMITLDPTYTIFRGTSALPWEDRTLESGLMRTYDAEGRALLPWATGLIDLDLDGRGDLVVTHGHDLARWADPRQRDVAQYVTAQRNLGGFRFEDVSTRTRLDRRGQWRGLTVGDLDRDGDADLIVGGDGEVPRVYRNEGVPGRHALGLRLRGSTSNPIGLGARVEVTVDGLAPQHFVAGNMIAPSSWSEPLVFFGTAERDRVARVRVTWPSGTVQELTELTTDRLYVLDEPELVVIEPASRHVAANGSATAVVRITPRRVDGTLNPDARAELAMIEGTRRTSLTPTRDMATGGWTATLPSRMSAGSAVLEIGVDGVVAGVHPRVWWE